MLRLRLNFENAVKATAKVGGRVLGSDPQADPIPTAALALIGTDAETKYREEGIKMRRQKLEHEEEMRRSKARP